MSCAGTDQRTVRPREIEDPGIDFGHSNLDSRLHGNERSWVCGSAGGIGLFRLLIMPI
jgi:hypothetical protein